MLFKKIDETDYYFMKKALLEAKKAFDRDEVPIGAVLVDANGKKILASAFNLVETKKCQSRHAEIITIEKACKKINNWRLNECKLYVTLEPCSMCMNLILLSRINTLVFALRSKLFGYNVDRYNSFELYKGPMIIKEGVCRGDSLNLMKLFFKSKRKNSE